MARSEFNLVLPDLSGAVARARAGLPHTVGDLQGMVDAAILLSGQGGLFLLDPRLHPVLNRVSSTPAIHAAPLPIPPSELWVEESIVPCKAAREAMGQRRYKGACVMLAGDPEIADVLRTFLTKGPGVELSAAFQRSKDNSKDPLHPFLLQLLGGLQEPPEAKFPSDAVWLLREIAAHMGGKSSDSVKIAEANEVARRFDQKGFHGYKTTQVGGNMEVDLALFQRWVCELDRMPVRSRQLGVEFKPEVKMRLVEGVGKILH